MVDKRVLEQDFVTRSKNGDTDAFKRLLLLYQDKIFRTAYWMLSSKEEAYDITQEVFIYSFENLKKFKEKSSFFTWLNWILIDKVSRKRRKSKVYNKYIRPLSNFHDSLGMIKEKSHGPVEILIKKERDAYIMKKVGALKEKYRLAIILCDFEKMSYKSAADIMKCSLSSVKTRLFRARQTLRKELKIKNEKLKES